MYSVNYSVYSSTHLEREDYIIALSAWLDGQLVGDIGFTRGDILKLFAISSAFEGGTRQHVDMYIGGTEHGWRISPFPVSSAADGAQKGRRNGDGCHVVRM